MKVYLSNYRNHWISPYTILEKVVFWKKLDRYSDRTKKVVDILNPICEGLKKVLDTVHPEVNYVKVDSFDTWNLDTTLAPIILAGLIEFKKHKGGLPMEFGYIGGEDYEDQKHFDFYKTNQELSDKASQQWDITLDKMIFAFEHIVDRDDWEQKFCSGEFDRSIAIGQEGWKGTYTCDYEGINRVNAQIQEGLELFGKYYRHLWD